MLKSYTLSYVIGAILWCVCIFAVQDVNAQILEPVKWQFAAKKISDREAVVFIKATLEEGWHLYSQHVKAGGPLPTSFSFAKSDGYTLNGKVLEPTSVIHFEEIFKMDVLFFENEVVFQQKLQLHKSVVNFTGTIKYMVCDDTSCVQDEKHFSIPIK